MKKQLSFLTEQQGFFLPYVLFITTIIFIVLTASINIYKNDIQITKQLSEQTKIKTMLQMAKKQFKDDTVTLDTSSTHVEYSFPDGTVRINYHPINKKDFDLTFFIRTKADTKQTFEKISVTPEEKSESD